MKVNLSMKDRNIFSLRLKLLHTPVETLASLTDMSFLGNFSLDSLAMHERQMDRVVLCSFAPMAACPPACYSALKKQCLFVSLLVCLGAKKNRLLGQVFSE